MQQITLKPWERQPGEPDRWFARFEVYRLMGTTRTLEGAFRLCAQAESLHARRPGHAWTQAAARWEWRPRAAAWDAEQRELLRTQEQDRRFDAREKRLSMIDRLLTAVFNVMVMANLPEMTLVDAREWLPTMRLLFKDLLIAERAELGLPVIQDAVDDADIPPFTGDELAQAQKELAEWDRPQPARLLAIIGPDPALTVDLAALRAVKADTGLDFHRIESATGSDIETYLRRERGLGRPVEMLHIAAHTGHEGIMLADGRVNGAWLSAKLQGVRILVLAGCESDRIGDWLAVVPHVVSFSVKIGHADAATFTQHFWSNIARGVDPDQALSNALRRCPTEVSEYIIKHW